MSTASRSRLLDNVLDNLDRLYDGDCLPVDTAALVLATAAAMSGTAWQPLLTRSWEALNGIRTGDANERLSAALMATGELRAALADGFGEDYPDSVAGGPSSG